SHQPLLLDDIEAFRSIHMSSPSPEVCRILYTIAL
ncbi:MAG: hypothetical protein JWM61_2466, partial [Micrococcaceae bacterium]|nr:hypothetical protein [Micrococcaceae bacterium]